MISRARVNAHQHNNTQKSYRKENL
uniref:Uncharacterized protein n=1 Tax=Arundo donax TaxID=35708 RepID=A0A0A8Z4R4_ARUDO